MFLTSVLLLTCTIKLKRIFYFTKKNCGGRIQSTKFGYVDINVSLKVSEYQIFFFCFYMDAANPICKYHFQMRLFSVFQKKIYIFSIHYNQDIRMGRFNRRVDQAALP